MEKNDKNESKIVIEKNKKWQAVIVDTQDTMALCFETLPDEIPIQGEVDDALEDIYGYETDTNIFDLQMTMDDGLYLVYYGDLEKEKLPDAKTRIIEYLTQIYKENKKRFKKCIKEDLED